VEREEVQTVGGKLTRRAFLHRSTGLVVGVALSGLLYVPEAWAAEAELSIADLQAAMASGQLTARALVQFYLERIEAVDRSGPTLRSVLETNPDLLAIADALDEERRSKGPRGPLHGIPILLKDNIDTADRMMTTAGSFALVGDPPAQDATVARKLRDAGAILMGKANLSEWANFRSTNSSSGWSARGGQTRNPYVLNQDPCGSSSGSGVAVAANLCAASLGSETDGSIMCPAAFNGVVGIKPTVGLLSRAGVIPIAHSQDTVGPMTRTVADAALLLGAMTGIDPRDAATQGSEGKGFADYTQFLSASALKGARIGVPYGRGDKVTRAAIQVLEDAGAVLVTSRITAVSGVGDAEFQVLLYEFKQNLNRYLAGRTGVPVHSLEELIAFNKAHASEEKLSQYNQTLFLDAQKKGPLTDAAYLKALEKSQMGSRAALDAALEKDQLVAMVAPGLSDGIGIAARAGYPSISVPAGIDRGMPVNLLFFGRAYSEPTLLGLAYAFEQLTKARRPPQFLARRPTS
jgi:amidase